MLLCYTVCPWINAYIVSTVIQGTATVFFLTSSHAELSPYKKQTNKKNLYIYVNPILVMSHACCCGKIRNSIWQAMIGEADAGDKTDMTGWKQLRRRSHWKTNQSMLSKATSHPINWHSLFRKIIYPSQIPPRRQLCVCACMCSRMCSVCYF